MLQDMLIFYFNVIALPMIFGGLVRRVFATGVAMDRRFWLSAFSVTIIDYLFWGIMVVCGYYGPPNSIDLVFTIHTVAFNTILYFLIGSIKIAMDKRVILTLEKMEEPAERKQRAWVICERILLGLFMVGMLLNVAMHWYLKNYNGDFSAFIYAIKTGVGGTSVESVVDGILSIAVPGVYVVALTLVCYITCFNGRWKLTIQKKEKAKTIKIRAWWVALCLFGFVLGNGMVLVRLHIFQWLSEAEQYSTIYEKYYVEGTRTLVKAPKQKRNLILVYLESMEVTYADEANGGIQDVNLIPNLTRLAQENVNFSTTNTMGGFMSCAGTGWTKAATMAIGAGINTNSAMTEAELNVDTWISLGDILQRDGYREEVILGSDGEFSGLSRYYRTHGGAQVLDYHDIVKNGYVPEDFYEWWGVRDEIVYRVAKDELLQLQAQEEPFFMTFFTMDTHPTGGYVCERCPNVYADPTQNVMKCADDQIEDFITWCQSQDFYKDTTIVVVGDHPRMDASLVGNMPSQERRVYNCFINATKKPARDVHNRIFTGMDIFPSVLSAMGYEIMGDHLGLGTDLFSSEKTLPEELGYEWFDRQMSYKSVFYGKHFIHEDENGTEKCNE